jgi:PPP family 3-phenylpropionic acid transporter
MLDAESTICKRPESTRICNCRTGARVPINRNLRPARRGSIYYLAYWAAIGIFMPFTNVYFVNLGLSGREIGLLAALLPLMTLTVAPALAGLADRRGWRVRILALSLAGLGIALILLSLPRSFLALAPLMGLLALARSPIGPVADSLVARMAVRHRLNFGGMRLWGSLGFALVAIASGALWQEVGYSFMFALAGLAFLPVALCALLLEEGPVIERAARRPLREVGRDRGLIVLMAAACVVGAALGMDGAFQGVYVNHLGGGGLIVGLLFGVSAFSEFPSMRYASDIARRLGGPRTLLLSYALLGAGYTGFALARDPFILVPLAMVKGFGFGLYFVSTVRLVDERTPPEWASTIQAALNAGAGGLAPLAASLLGGAIYDALGPAAVFVACAGALFLAMLIMIAAIAAGVFVPAAKMTR